MINQSNHSSGGFSMNFYSPQYQNFCFLVCCSANVFLQNQQSNRKADGEKCGHKQSGFQIPACHFRNTSHHGRTYRGTQVTGQCQECKHCRSAFRTFLRGYAERSRPHNTHRHAAKSAASKSQDRQCGQRSQQIASGTHDSANKHHLGQIQLFAELSVHHTGYTHKQKTNRALPNHPPFSKPRGQLP